MNPAKFLALFGRSQVPLGGVTTWSPTDKGAGVVVSGGNLTMSVAGATPNTVRSTTFKDVDSGKFYAEVVAGAGSDFRVGFAVSTATLSNYLGSDLNGQGYSSDGNLYLNSVAAAVYSSYASGATIGLAIDTASGVKRLWWSLNGVWQGGDPVAGTGGQAYSTTPVFLAASAKSGASLSLNCGQSPFRLDVPSGFAQWG